jgi:hypothetical protein
MGGRWVAALGRIRVETHEGEWALGETTYHNWILRRKDGMLQRNLLIRSPERC